MNQKGFSNILVVVLTLVIIAGVAGYFVFTKKSSELNKPSTSTQNSQVSAKVERETVMTEGMKIIARTSAGPITIKAGKGFERTYTWGNCTGSVTMWPRTERWYGSYGIYYPGPGNHWKDCNGITRAVVEEGQQHFDNLEQAINFLNTREQGSVYTHDGSVVLWGLVPERNQLNAEVWQILINGSKPTQLPGAQDDSITFTFE